MRLITVRRTRTYFFVCTVVVVAFTVVVDV